MCSKYTLFAVFLLCYVARIRNEGEAGMIMSSVIVTAIVGMMGFITGAKSCFSENLFKININ